MSTQIQYKVLYAIKEPTQDPVGKIFRLYVLNDTPYLAINSNDGEALDFALSDTELIELGKALIKAWEQIHYDKIKA